MHYSSTLETEGTSRGMNMSGHGVDGDNNRLGRGAKCRTCGHVSRPLGYCSPVSPSTLDPCTLACSGDVKETGGERGGWEQRS